MQDPRSIGAIPRPSSTHTSPPATRRPGSRRITRAIVVAVAALLLVPWTVSAGGRTPAETERTDDERRRLHQDRERLHCRGRRGRSQRGRRRWRRLLPGRHVQRQPERVGRPPGVAARQPGHPHRDRDDQRSRREALQREGHAAELGSMDGIDPDPGRRRHGPVGRHPRRRDRHRRLRQGPEPDPDERLPRPDRQRDLDLERGRRRRQHAHPSQQDLPDEDVPGLADHVSRQREQRPWRRPELPNRHPRQHDRPGLGRHRLVRDRAEAVEERDRREEHDQGRQGPPQPARDRQGGDPLQHVRSPRDRRSGRSRSPTRGTRSWTRTRSSATVPRAPTTPCPSTRTRCGFARGGTTPPTCERSSGSPATATACWTTAWRT